MNPFINKLYNYYLQSEALLTNNFDLLTPTQLEKIDTIRVNVTLLDNIRECLLKKQYSNARLIINKLDRIEKEHMVQLNSAIEELETQDLPYDLNLGIATPNPSNNLLNNEFNNFEHNSKTLIESIDQLNARLQNIISTNPNILDLEKNIQALHSTVGQIKSSFDTHLQTVNTDFLKVMTTYRDQTIESVNSIKKSAIDTSDMIMHDLPNQVKKITDTATDSVNKSISKILWSNYILFILGFFICVLISAWFMGERVGRTMQQELYQAVYNNYAASKDNPTQNTSKNKIHKN